MPKKERNNHFVLSLVAKIQLIHVLNNIEFGHYTISGCKVLKPQLIPAGQMWKDKWDDSWFDNVLSKWYHSLVHRPSCSNNNLIRLTMRPTTNFNEDPSALGSSDFCIALVTPLYILSRTQQKTDITIQVVFVLVSICCDSLSLLKIIIWVHLKRCVSGPLRSVMIFTSVFSAIWEWMNGWSTFDLVSKKWNETERTCSPVIYVKWNDRNVAFILTTY